MDEGHGSPSDGRVCTAAKETYTEKAQELQVKCEDHALRNRHFRYKEFSGFSKVYNGNKVILRYFLDTRPCGTERMETVYYIYSEHPREEVRKACCRLFGGDREEPFNERDCLEDSVCEAAQKAGYNYCFTVRETNYDRIKLLIY